MIIPSQSTIIATFYEFQREDVNLAMLNYSQLLSLELSIVSEVLRTQGPRNTFILTER